MAWGGVREAHYGIKPGVGAANPGKGRQQDLRVRAAADSDKSEMALFEGEEDPSISGGCHARLLSRAIGRCADLPNSLIRCRGAFMPPSALRTR